MAGGADPITMILQIVTTFPFNIIIIIGIVGYVLYTIWSSRGPPLDNFEVEDFRDTVFTFLEKLMNDFGIPSSSFLVRGIENQGKIDKWYPLTQKMKPYKIDQKINKLVEEKEFSKKAAGANKAAEDINAIIFQIGKKSFFSFLTGSKPKFVILERDSLDYDPNSKTWGMSETVSLIPYANVYIASKRSEQWINNISFMRSQEEILTYSQNFARKTAWLELSHAKIMDFVLGKEDKKKLGWDTYRKKALGYDIDEDDD